MTELMVRVSDTWLRLREPADAEARSRGLARAAGAGLGTGNGSLVAHDLGPETARWGGGSPPCSAVPSTGCSTTATPTSSLVALGSAADRGRGRCTGHRRGAARRPHRVEGRRHLAGASLVTASALLDVLTSHEVDSLVRRRVTAGCPAPPTLSVTGRVRLSPADPLDHLVAAAFDDHQRRTTGGRTHLGPGTAFLRRGAVPEPRTPGHHATEPVAARRGDRVHC